MNAAIREREGAADLPRRRQRDIEDAGGGVVDERRRRGREGTRAVGHGCDRLGRERPAIPRHGVLARRQVVRDGHVAVGEPVGDTAPRVGRRRRRRGAARGGRVERQPECQILALAVARPRQARRELRERLARVVGVRRGGEAPAQQRYEPHRGVGVHRPGGHVEQRVVPLERDEVRDVPHAAGRRGREAVGHDQRERPDVAGLAARLAARVDLAYVGEQRQLVAPRHHGLEERERDLERLARALQLVVGDGREAGDMYAGGGLHQRLYGHRARRRHLGGVEHQQRQPRDDVGAAFQARPLPRQRARVEHDVRQRGTEAPRGVGGWVDGVDLGGVEREARALHRERPAHRRRRCIGDSRDRVLGLDRVLPGLQARLEVVSHGEVRHGATIGAVGKRPVAAAAA